MRQNNWVCFVFVSGVIGCSNADSLESSIPKDTDAHSVELLMSTLMHGEIEPCG